MLQLKDFFEKVPVTSYLNDMIGIDINTTMPYLKEGKEPPILVAYKLVLVQKGQLIYRLKDSVRELNTGEMAFLAPWEEALILSKSSDLRGSVLFCSQSIYDRLVTENNGDLGVLHTRRIFPILQLSDVQHQNMESFFMLMSSNIDNAQFFREQIVLGLMRTIQMYIVELMTFHFNSNTLSDQRKTIYQKFIKLATEHHIKERKLTFYDSELCISTTYLSRIVREVSGCTVKAILSEMLYTEARYQLVNTDLSVSEISYNLGFEEQSAFTHFFRKNCGMIPSQYRANSTEAI